VRAPLGPDLPGSIAAPRREYHSTRSSVFTAISAKGSDTRAPKARSTALCFGKLIYLLNRDAKGAIRHEYVLN